MFEHDMLVTGTGSGLGKYLSSRFKSYGFSRGTDVKLIQETNKFKTIVHCAYNKARDINSESLYQYMYDNVLLTYELTKVQHEKFIYISTVDVYPKNDNVHKEDEIISVDEISSFYGITKLMSEEIVKNNCKNWIIFRPTALLGHYIKPNAVTKIMDKQIENFTLSQDSIFNYVSHEHMYRAVKLAMKEDLRGIFNLATEGNMDLWEVAETLEVEDFIYGDYLYDIGKIDNSKIKEYLPFFGIKSKTVVSNFAKERGT